MQRHPRVFLAALVLAAFLVALLPPRVGAQGPPSLGAAKSLAYEITAVHPHDPAAFTQGLVLYRGSLLESTGRWGTSGVRRVDIPTGRVLLEAPFSDRFFAEGIALVRNRLLVLTWKSGTGFVLDPDSLERTTSFTYPGQGWGLAFGGKRLYLSDGTALIRILDPETLARAGSLKVTGPNGPIHFLNELEWIETSQGPVLLANVWQTDQVAVIDPASGRVRARLDLAPLRKMLGAERRLWAEVLNGLAWDPAQKRLYATGKYWPKLFELRVPYLE